MRTVLVALLASAMYATLRYNVFAGVPWSDWPVFVLNKVFALSSLVLLVVALKRTWRPSEPSNASIFFAAGICASLHVMLSLALLSPNYYEKLFVHGRLTAPAGFSVVAGSLATVLFCLAGRARPGLGEDERARALGVVCLVIALHVLLQGFAGWLVPSKWPGMMPPITLLSFLLGLAAFVIGLSPKRND